MIEVRIDRLVLTGVVEDPGLLRDAVQAELARQMVAAAPRRGWRESRRRVVVAQLAEGTLAEAIASSIHRGIREAAG
ncbi:hypothetical protein [Amycolatopsis albidoflavus]|uniref:Uncharacterized protein n=1 Tax=Amycolatopsis albidoflavus TaxID=102226 RepID=A0ABW5IJG5_9PSEU